jgi:thioredoxin-related protein
VNSIVKKLEVAANVAIVIVSILLVVVLVKYLTFNDTSNKNKQARITKGQRIPLQNVDWARNGQTLLVVLQKDCRFCSESAPFYKTLVHEAALRGNIRLVAVLPQAIEDSKKYLNTLGVPIEDVRQEQLAVEGTPTLIMVDGKGVASEIWLGKLKPDKEAEVLSRL